MFKHLINSCITVDFISAVPENKSFEDKTICYCVDNTSVSRHVTREECSRHRLDETLFYKLSPEETDAELAAGHRRHVLAMIWWKWPAFEYTNSRKRSIKGEEKNKEPDWIVGTRRETGSRPHWGYCTVVLVRTGFLAFRFFNGNRTLHFIFA